MSVEYENLDELLVKLVRKFDNIYDKSHSTFKNLNVREHTWNVISQIMKKPKGECNQRWNVLRTRYALEKRKSRVEGRPSTWPLYENMQFLDKFMLPRKSYGNYKTMSSQSSVSPSCSIWDVRPSNNEQPDPVFVDVDSRDGEIRDKEEKVDVNFPKIEASTPTSLPSYDYNQDWMAPNKYPKLDNSLEFYDAEYSFGRTVSLMLKNIKGHKRRRRVQVDIMKLLANYDSGSDSN